MNHKQLPKLLSTGVNILVHVVCYFCIQNFVRLSIPSVIDDPSVLSSLPFVK